MTDENKMMTSEKIGKGCGVVFASLIVLVIISAIIGFFTPYDPLRVWEFIYSH